jgi:hypothetical protein
MANYLITGYHGEPHVTVENDRGINAGIVGEGRFVLPVGKRLKAEYIGNNTVRLYDGKLMDNGAAAGIPAGEFIDLTIATGSQGMKRHDLIVFQYSKDASTSIEKGEFVIVRGTEATGAASDPALTQANLVGATAVLDQMPLWRVVVSGTDIAQPEQVFSMAGALTSAVPGAGEGNLPTFDANGGLVDSGVNAAGVTFAKMTLSGTTLIINTVQG